MGGGTVRFVDDGEDADEVDEDDEDDEESEADDSEEKAVELLLAPLEKHL